MKVVSVAHSIRKDMRRETFEKLLFKAQAKPLPIG
jgi:hypothetical protein